MKKIGMLMGMVFSLGLMAQEGPKITSAVIAERNQDTVKAKEYIDEAAQIIAGKSTEEVGYKDMRKFLYFSGRINLMVAQSTNPALQAKYPNALKEAEEALFECIRFEKELDKEKYTDDCEKLLPTLGQLYANKALNLYNAEKYEEAYAGYMKTFEVKQASGVTDTSMLYNSAILAQNLKNYEEAMRLNKQLLELGYKGYQYRAVSVQNGQAAEFANKDQMEDYVDMGLYKDPEVIKNDVRPGIYVSLANASMAAGDSVAFRKYLKEGRAAYPENQTLLTTELDIYLKNKEYDKALVNLDQAIAQDPNGKMASIYYYNKGIILHTEMKDAEKAMEAYGKAVALDSMYADAWYMQGLVYYDKAKGITDEMNNLPLNATKKYNEMKEKQKEYFKQALPYFEKAHKVAPQDVTTLQALREIYRSMKMVEEYKATEAKLAELQ